MQYWATSFPAPLLSSWDLGVGRGRPFLLGRHRKRPQFIHDPRMRSVRPPFISPLTTTSLGSSCGHQ